MFKLIIVDDEEIIRHSLLKLIDWKSIGFEVAGTFEDGRDAIEYISQNTVDAILTDVKMYDVSGIDIAKFVYENNPGIKICIISGYQEFDYVREALKYNACDYILKPIDTRELYKVFESIAQTLKNRDVLPFDFFQKDEYTRLLDCSDRLISAVLASSNDEIRQYHSELFSYMSPASYELLFLVVSRLFEQIYKQVSHYGIKLKPELSFRGVMDGFNKAKASDMPEKTLESLMALSYYFTENQNQYNKNIVSRLKNYVSEHLSEDISLDDISHSLSFNSSYLSRKFKSVTGSTIVDYIAKYRIEKAMELIRTTNDNMDTISKKVGFKNAKYLYHCFKKHTGYTVLEYKKLLMSK